MNNFSLTQKMVMRNW